MATVQDFLTRCFRMAGIYAPGDAISADEMNDALAILNDFTGLLNTDDLAIFDTADAYHTLAAQTGANPRPTAITIGPSGATITAARPQQIVGANICVTSTDPNVEVPLTLINEQEYDAIRVKNVGSPIPTKLYYAPSFPNGSIYLWPYLNAACKLHLFTWSLLDAALTLLGTFNLPPGYNEMYRTHIAVRMRMEWGKDPDPVLLQLAQEAKASVYAKNFSTVLQDCDPALIGNGGGSFSKFNYLIGE